MTGRAPSTIDEMRVAYEKANENVLSIEHSIAREQSRLQQAKQERANALVDLRSRLAGDLKDLPED